MKELERRLYCCSETSQKRTGAAHHAASQTDILCSWLWLSSKLTISIIRRFHISDASETTSSRRHSWQSSQRGLSATLQSPLRGDMNGVITSDIWVLIFTVVQSTRTILKTRYPIILPEKGIDITWEGYVDFSQKWSFKVQLSHSPKNFLSHWNKRHSSLLAEQSASVFLPLVLP